MWTFQDSASTLVWVLFIFVNGESKTGGLNVATVTEKKTKKIIVAWSNKNSVNGGIFE